MNVLLYFTSILILNVFISSAFGNAPLHEWTSSIEESNSTINEQGETEHIAPENLTTWIFEDGTFIPMAKLQGEHSYSIITDHLGTPVEAYDEDGTKVWSRELNIYGETRKEFGVTNFIPFLYQGQYLDQETQLAYNRFRYYSPESGMYISQDPIRLDSRELNLYTYVNDSNSWVDVYGLSETFFRTISKEHAEILERTGKLPATKETFTSPTKVFSDGYDGVTYEFTMKDGTTSQLEDIGVRDQSKLTRSKYPTMPEVQSGWTEDHAYFKQEGPKGKKQINIGLGKGKALGTFNDNIESFKKACS